MYDCTVITLDTDTDHSVRAYIMEDGTLAIHDHKRKRQTLLMQADWYDHDLGMVGSVLARSIARSAIVLRDLCTQEHDDYDTDQLIESIREGLFVMLHDGIRSSDRCIAMANALRTSIVASITVENVDGTSVGTFPGTPTKSRTVRECIALRRAGKAVAK